MKIEPKFPIIQIIEGDSVIYGCTNTNDYYKCDINYIPKYKNSTVVDSNGTMFKITSAKKSKWGTLLWGYHPWLKGRVVVVDFEYELPQKLDWAEFKHILIERLSKKVNPIWYPNSIKKIEQRLESSNSESFQEIIELFSYELD
jgi:hypothetical protein